MDLLARAQQIRALAQAGLSYTTNPFDRERYEQLLQVAAELAAPELDRSVSEVARVFSLERGYPTPKLDVRAVVAKENRLLMVREGTDGRWALPGGWADEGESASEATAREVREETGYRVRPSRLLAVYDKAKHDHPQSQWYTYKLFFLCELLGGEVELSHETIDVAWFSAGELPELSTHRVTRAQVARMFELVEHPDWPADFD